jgi:hypothetical protein
VLGSEGSTRDLSAAAFDGEKTAVGETVASVGSNGLRPGRKARLEGAAVVWRDKTRGS